MPFPPESFEEKDILSMRPMKSVGTQASDVYKIELNTVIGDSGRNKGFAKKALGKGDEPNEAVTNLGLNPKNTESLEESPRLIVRAVASSKLSKELDLNIVADETFGRDHADGVIGISAIAPGRGLMEKLEPSEEAKAKGVREVFKHNHVDFENPDIQRGLSDLQVFDQLTGQLDRHEGNIFVDENTGKVTGIDNDMAFGGEGAQTLGGNATIGLPLYIHQDTANAINNLTPERLTEVLSSVKDGEQALNQEEIDKSVERLKTIQEQLKETPPHIVDGVNQQFNHETYQAEIDRQKTFDETSDVGNASYSYLARAQKKYDNAKVDDERVTAAKLALDEAKEKLEAHRNDRESYDSQIAFDQAETPLEKDVRMANMEVDQLERAALGSIQEQPADKPAPKVYQPNAIEQESAKISQEFSQGVESPEEGIQARLKSAYENNLTPLQAVEKARTADIRNEMARVESAKKQEIDEANKVPKANSLRKVFGRGKSSEDVQAEAGTIEDRAKLAKKKVLSDVDKKFDGALLKAEAETKKIAGSQIARAAASNPAILAERQAFANAVQNPGWNRSGVSQAQKKVARKRTLGSRKSNDQGVNE